MKSRTFAIGDEVRIFGWQKHWPNGTAKIVSVNLDETEAVLSKPLLGRRVWPMDQLREPFK